MRQLTNIFRRVYRIFAHAWYSHRDVFWNVEGRTGLYIFYKTVCDVYGLVPEDNYTIPPEAEGIEPTAEPKSAAPPLIMKREPSDSGSQISDSTLVEGMSDHSLSTAGTTKRHRHSPSVGATSVQTVVEENEEEEERPSLQARPVTQIFESTPEDAEDEAASEAKDAVDQTVKQSAGEETSDPAPTEGEKQSEAAATESGNDADAEDGPPGSTPAEKEPSNGEPKATEEDDKPAATESEQAERIDASAKSTDKDDEPEEDD